MSSDALALLGNAGAVAPLQSTVESTPYVAFFSPKAKQVATIIAKLGDMPEGTPYIVRPDGSMERLTNMRFWVTPLYAQFFATIDDSNAVLQAVFPPEKPPGKDYKEHIMAVVLVNTTRGIEPARLTFRTTKCPAARDVINEVLACATNPDQWAEQSADHAAAVSAIGKDWLRVCGIIVLKPEKAKSPPYRPYTQANAQVGPTSAGMFNRIMQSVSSQDAQDLLAKCIEEHNKQLAAVKQKVK